MSCKILRLDPCKARRVHPEMELPAYSAMTADGVMSFPVERRQAEVVDWEELCERRRQREADGAD
jgi:hypothetical protein